MYQDDAGTMSIMVAKDGTVTAYAADGTRYSGTYSAQTYQFAFSGASPGTVAALDALGLPANRGSSSWSSGSSYGFSEVLGSLDIHGNLLTLGSWQATSGDSINGFGLSFTDALNGTPSLIRFAATRSSVSWVWSHANANGGNSQSTTMQINALNQLTLLDPNPSTGTTQPTLVLDPSVSGTSQIPGTVQMPGTVKLPGTVLVAPQGDLLMGTFTTGTAPQ